MSEKLTKTAAVKTLKATPARHKAIRMLAAESGENILEITDQVLAIGIRELKVNRPELQPTQSN